MAEITATMVKDLREKTGAGMMDCKKALVQADGDIAKAVENLRKAGQAKAEKKAGRATNEGRIAYQIGDGVAALVEVVCETDFASRNEKFTSYVDGLVKRVAVMNATGDVSQQVVAGEEGNLADLITNIGENIQVRRALRWIPEGKAAVYIHGAGKIGVLVDVKGEADEEYLNNLCMHIAAFSPQYVRPEDVPQSVIDKEKEIAAAQPDLVGKPAKILDKILVGKISKFYSDVCLIKQPWVRDDKLSVEKVNPKAQIVRFVRWQVGEEL